MALSALGLIALIGYLLILIPACIQAKKKNTLRNAHDHYLANRSLGLWVLFLTLYATSFSGNTLLGQTGQSYRAGFSWVTSVGLWMAAMIGFHFLVPKLRPIAIKEKFITPGDWLRYRFSGDDQCSVLRCVIAAILCLALINFLFAQLKAAGEILSIMTDGFLSYEAFVIVFALIILVYDAMGGLRAVAWTDVIQGLIMLGGFACLVYWMMNYSGGLENIASHVASQRPESATTLSAAQQIKWVSLMLLGGMATIVYPQTIQRVYAASSNRTLYLSLALMSIIVLYTSLVVLFTGWTAIQLVDLNTGVQADQVLLRIIELWAMSSWWNSLAAVLVILSVLAAIMSTADSVLLSLISMIRHDFFEQSDRDTLRYDNYIAIIIMVIVSLCALYRDVSLWRLIELKFELLIQAFPAFVVALHWRRLNALSVLLGILSGLVTMVVFLSMGIPSFSGVNMGLIALMINITVLAVSHVLWLANP